MVPREAVMVYNERAVDLYRFVPHNESRGPKSTIGRLATKKHIDKTAPYTKGTYLSVRSLRERSTHSLDAEMTPQNEVAG
jgi:hypothetical protein